MENEIINRVANSNLVSIDLEDFFPNTEVLGFDIAGLLWQGLILKEKEFRESLKNYSWAEYKDKTVAIYCSADAIIPTWAFMLVGIHLDKEHIPYLYGNETIVLGKLYEKIIDSIDIEKFRGRKVVIKGCSKRQVPTDAYVRLCNRLHPVASSIMYGEPCSTVPLWKNPALK